MAHKILRLPSVKDLTGLSRSTIYLRISKNEFPAPISLGAKPVNRSTATLFFVTSKLNPHRALILRYTVFVKFLSTYHDFFPLLLVCHR